MFFQNRILTWISVLDTFEYLLSCSHWNVELGSNIPGFATWSCVENFTLSGFSSILLVFSKICNHFFQFSARLLSRLTDSGDVTSSIFVKDFVFFWYRALKLWHKQVLVKDFSISWAIIWPGHTKHITQWGCVCVCLPNVTRVIITRVQWLFASSVSTSPLHLLKSTYN